MNFQAAQRNAAKAARAAGNLMLANWNRPKRINVAEARDIRLELDVRCQKLVTKILLSGASPQIALLGEEGCTGDVNSEYRWVVDPIDGTVNYFADLPHAAVSIALQWRGEGPSKPDSKLKSRESRLDRVSRYQNYQTVLGMIYCPFTDELWSATRGGQTKLNGRTVRISNCSKLRDAIISMGVSKTQENLEKSLPHVVRLARRARKIRIMGSAALELAYVASGRLDAYIERTVNLWDIAAGGLMVECAGGEFFLNPLPDGRFRMCADNGKLRKKLQLDSLLK